MKKTIKTIALMLFAGFLTFTQQGCFGSSDDSEENGNSSHSTNSSGQSITFTDCSIETNAKDDKGIEYLVYHFTAELSGMKEKGIQMILSVESPKGTPYTYVDNEGDEIIVKETKDFKNKNKTDSFSLNNKIVRIQNSKLHLKDGENTYYVRLTAYDENTHEEIGASPYITVTITGKSNSNKNSSNNGSPTASISNTSLEPNVIEKGARMLKCHYTLKANGVKSHKLKLIVSIECPEGIVLYEGTREYTATYDSSVWKDKWLAINNNNFLQPGTNTYYVRYLLYDENLKTTLATSPYMSCTLTGAYG